MVPVSTNITFLCKDDLWVETNAAVREEAGNSITITCSENGTFSVDEDWPPSCVEVTYCSFPPLTSDMVMVSGQEYMINGTDAVLVNGSYDHLVDASFEYLSNVSVTCIDGSMFDVDDDGEGDTHNITLECLWNKTWSPWTSVIPRYNRFYI